MTVKTKVKLTECQTNKTKSKMKKTERTLNELIVEKMVSLQTENRVGTNYNYRTLKNYIEKHYGIVKMKDVNPKWAAGLHKKMKDEGKSAATIKNYFALLQSITNYGAYIGCTVGDVKLTRSKSYELDKVKIEKPKTRRNKWLTREDIGKLWDYWIGLPNKPKGEKKWIGLFMASYLCNGCNMADLVRLRYDDEYFTSNKKVFGFYREKVKRTSGAYARIPIIDRLKTVIDAIGDDEVYDGLVFGSFLDGTDTEDSVKMAKQVMYLNSYCSKVLKNVCKKIGIRDDVSFGFARHSYCSNLNHAGVNYAIIERNMSHSLGITDNYLGDVSIEALFDANSKLFIA